MKCKFCNEFIITSDAEKHPCMSYSQVHKELSATARSSSENQILDISVRDNALFSMSVPRSGLVR